MDHPFTYRRENGFVLVASLGAVVIAAVLVLLYLSFTQQTEQAARKRQYQDRGEESIEIAMISLRDSLTEQFQQDAQVEISALSTISGPNKGSLEHGMYNLIVDAAGSPSIVSATERHATVSLLTFPDDPFRGATPNPRFRVFDLFLGRQPNSEYEAHAEYRPHLCPWGSQHYGRVSERVLSSHCFRKRESKRWRESPSAIGAERSSDCFASGQHR
jgi:hypothetical protein